MEGLLTTLVLLACPVGMGLMMLFMGRGMLGSKKDEPGSRPSLAQLKSEQARLHAEVERLEARDGTRSPVASGQRS